MDVFAFAVLFFSVKNQVMAGKIAKNCIKIDPGFGPEIDRGPKHGTTAWPEAWDHCVAPNMGPLRGPKHGTRQMPPPWEGGNAFFPKNF